MTRIHFLHGARDRYQAVVAWLAQRSQRGLPALVLVPDQETMTQIDRLLWTQTALGFIPHCCFGHRLEAETPIVLTSTIDSISQSLCLLNLTNDIPSDFTRFTELVEIVSTDDAVRLPARERFRFYREQGCELQNVDISQGIPE